MLRRKEPSAGVLAAIARATGLLRGACVESPDDIAVTRIASSVGARVVYAPVAMADAASVVAGDEGWILIDASWRGTFRARWSIAHELGHYLLHHDADAIARIHGGGPKLRSDYRYEREADAFAAELLMPAFLYGAECARERPTLDAVRALGECFGVSLQAAGRRYAALTPGACAFVESDGGVIYHPERSAAFRGVAVKGRGVEDGTLAKAIERGDAARGGRVASGGVWGSAKLGVEMTEEAELIPETGVIVTLLTHPRVEGRVRRSRAG